MGDRAIPRSIVIEVTTAEKDKSFRDTIDMRACGAAWPGYPTPDAK